MINYNIENNINFYEQLYNSLDYDSDNEETNCCQITGDVLTDKHIIMECSHKFNYEPLYKEICRQKFVFKTYDVNSLSKADKQKYKELRADYFIKCPYCRNVQFTILPHYEELGLKRVYGVNTIDKMFGESHMKSSVAPFTMFGVNFGLGQCSHSYSYDSQHCNQTMVAKIPNSNISFCKFHYKNGLKAHELAEKKKMAEEKKKHDDEILAARTKLLNEKNAIRAAKGQPLLKRMPKLEIGSEQNIVLDISPSENSVVDTAEVAVNVCQAVLKTGANKGNKCGCKLVNEQEFCKRHSK
jgi:hypothetical protein